MSVNHSPHGTMRSICDRNSFFSVPAPICRSSQTDLLAYPCPYILPLLTLFCIFSVRYCTSYCSIEFSDSQVKLLVTRFLATQTEAVEIIPPPLSILPFSITGNQKVIPQLSVVSCNGMSAARSSAVLP